MDQTNRSQNNMRPNEHLPTVNPSSSNPHRRNGSQTRQNGSHFAGGPPSSSNNRLLQLAIRPPQSQRPAPTNRLSIPQLMNVPTDPTSEPPLPIQTGVTATAGPDVPHFPQPPIQHLPQVPFVMHPPPGQAAMAFPFGHQAYHPQPVQTELIPPHFPPPPPMPNQWLQATLRPNLPGFPTPQLFMGMQPQHPGMMIYPPVQNQLPRPIALPNHMHQPPHYPGFALPETGNPIHHPIPTSACRVSGGSLPEGTYFNQGVMVFPPPPPEQQNNRATLRPSMPSIVEEEAVVRNPRDFIPLWAIISPAPPPPPRMVQAEDLVDGEVHEQTEGAEGEKAASERSSSSSPLLLAVSSTSTSADSSRRISESVRSEKSASEESDSECVASLEDVLPSEQSAPDQIREVEEESSFESVLNSINGALAEIHQQFGDFEMKAKEYKDKIDSITKMSDATYSVKD